jgi:DNA-binding MarR family transcriptional regulator
MANTREELLQALREEWRRSSAEGIFYVQAIAERSGMNLTDLQCINILTSTGPITAGQLAEEMRLTTGAITGLVNRLEQRGYVRRTKDPRDARRVVIEPDSEALERAGVGIFASESEAAWENLINSYDDQALAILLDFARKTDALTREETARIRAASEGDGGDGLTAPLGSTTSGRLVFKNGAYRVALRADLGIDDLYQARFESPAPTFTVEGGVVSVRYPKRFKLFGRPQPGEISLNTSVPWAIEVRGGAAEVGADLRGLAVTSFTVTGGATELTLTLPEPSGVVPVRLTGGAFVARILRPSGVPARLSMAGGFFKVTFDNQAHEVMGGKMMTFQSPGFNEAADRYEIEIKGGANEITIQ